MAATLGWLSTIGTFCAYLLLSRGHWTATSLRYSLLNALGGIAGAMGSSFYGVWPSVVSNLLWAAIGAHAVCTTLMQRHRIRVRVRGAAVRATTKNPVPTLI